MTNKVVKSYPSVKGYRVYRSTYETLDSYGCFVTRGHWFAVKDGTYLSGSNKKNLLSFIGCVAPKKLDNKVYENWGIK